MHRTARVRTVLPIVGMLLLNAVMACSTTTDPSGVVTSVTFKPVSSLDPLVAPPVTVQATGSTVTITGLIGTPTPCYKLAASQEISGSTLVVHLAATPSPQSSGGCIAAVASLQYVVKVRDLPPAITHLVVDQKGAVSGFPAVLADQDIALPV